MNASSLSQFEFCGRLPSIYRTYEPKQLPIRSAAQHYFERGVRYRYGGVENAGASIRDEFISEAIDHGYIYPKGDPYVIANDHASWLEGVINLMPDLPLEPIPLIEIGDELIQVDGFVYSEVPHLFRMAKAFTEDVLWPEMILSLRYPLTIVHTFRLPHVSKSATETVGGRIHSPACVGYQHPLTGHIRLAKLGDEKSFGKNWKRIGRWEDQTLTWDEWESGIIKDECLGEIYRNHNVVIDESAHAGIRRDALQIIKAIEENNPRRRERCGQCDFLALCHGGEDGSSQYRPTDEILRRMRTGPSHVHVPPGQAQERRKDDALYVLSQ